MTVVLCFSTILSGCASTGSYKIEKYAKKVYVPLQSVCRKYKLSWEWNGFSNVIVVRKLHKEIKLCIGSSLMLANSVVEDLGAPVNIKNGIVMVPKTIEGIFSLSKTKYAERAKSLKIMPIEKIVIDAGHGGKDPGAVGIGGIKEKDIVLDIAKRLRTILKKKNITVVMTRDRDIFIPLKRRFEIANKENADFFISIHANAAHSSSARGFEAYYLSPGYDDFSKAVQIRENAAVQYEKYNKIEYSKDLNAVLWDMILSENRIESVEMAKIISFKLKKILKLRTRYIKGAMFYVLKGARMPAVLIETGYVTNSQEASQLNNPYYRQMLAESIAAGIMGFKERFELTNGFSK